MTFESGVIKIQSGCQDELNDLDNKAVAFLRSDPVYSTGNNVTDDSVLQMKQRLSKRRKTCTKKRTYIPCNFILGSVAEVERVWSLPKQLLHGDVRASMTPLLFEAFLFLRFYERFWDAELVAQAISHSRTEHMKVKIEKLEKEVNTVE